ncbi:hypothetical protein HMPREF0653_01527 [Prevotella disiens JCM 6334 = ATCC 29426]|uniref:Uncharacterized protein n=1 Tax=Prevotella disiens JCM 6334 = ATCC 29426 TaxID=1235811 RepID=A0ABP2YB20_9BACT|nr:hypothetical protein HMPREF0653_01527 [Prevotella disiens JCM 6334 = ATCC 29426]
MLHKGKLKHLQTNKKEESPTGESPFKLYKKTIFISSFSFRNAYFMPL